MNKFLKNMEFSQWVIGFRCLLKYGDGNRIID